jgi:hypothetical protein
MSEEPHIPRRYVTIRGKRATAEVWSSIPGRETEEVWLKGVRPVVKLSGRESEHMYKTSSARCTPPFRRSACATGHKDS